MSGIAIVDYGIGNIKSISNAFEKVGAEIVLTRDKGTILGAQGVVLPGVGAFSHGMEKLNEYGLNIVLKEYSDTGKPLLGICLGMQMLFDKSSEFSETQGLGIIPGSVEKLKLLSPDVKKLPHISWNELSEKKLGSWKGTILDGLKSFEDMYFVHSFAVHPDDPNDVLSTTMYSDYEFCSSVKRKNTYGCQFHPEKSSKEGLKIIKNFVKISKEYKNV